MSLDRIEEQLQQTRRLGGQQFSPDAWYHAGLEERVQGDGYFWDGLQRARSAPQLVFQVTLSGWGAYEEAGVVQKIEPGKAFLALVPSPHRYYLPPDAPHWRFFWLVIRHAYIVQRLSEQHQTMGAVLSLSPESRLLAQAATLCAGGFRDRFAEELALFSFLTEYERHADHTLTQSTPGREVLEESVRRYVRENLERPVDISELARHFGLSRTRFTHHFTQRIGEPPARYLTGLRLEEVAQRLVTTDDTLQVIALATGFADANHLVKVFRRRYHTTPGAFRKQLRG
ncbi:AraC family transcriptional regulator [Armatimonas sp.]|uniref:AraC family transcriptional regulator n=1 Tax=Armatimonas sp. TaxID=1872638 RepID=UPI00286AD532|nr:AraC family transcriptional regulator [Armatimonas sp.]